MTTDLDELEHRWNRNEPADVTYVWQFVDELIARLRAAESGNAECARDLCGHRLADHGEACGVGVEGEMGWIICGCQEFVK